MPAQIQNKRPGVIEVFVILLSLLVVGGIFGSIWHRMQSVRTGWNHDTLTVSSWQQHVTVTGFRYRHEKETFTAILPQPRMAYGDITQRFPIAELEHLQWARADGSMAPVPAVGTHLQVLYYIPRTSVFKR